MRAFMDLRIYAWKVHKKGAFMERQIIVSVGMGPGQLDFIRFLKNKGYIVVAFGKGQNSEEAVSIVDYSCELDTYDAEAAIKWIDSLNLHIDAVGSYAGGRAVRTVQILSNYYNVPTKVPQELMVSGDKREQQLFYEKYGLSSIKTWDSKTVLKSDVSDIMDDKFIIKPMVGRGSEGIRYVNKNELLNLIGEDILKREDSVVQNVKEGKEYRCLIMVQNSEIILLTPILRKSYKNTVFLGELSIDNSNYDRMYDFFRKFVNQAEIVNSIIKADVIVSEREINLIEMDIGVGGGTYYKKFVSKIYNRDIMDDYVKLLTGVIIDRYTEPNKYMCMDYVYNHKGKPVKYNIDECKKGLEGRIANCDIIINRLHPEKSGRFMSNADFLFVVIYEKKHESQDFWIDEFINNNYLYD